MCSILGYRNTIVYWRLCPSGKVGKMQSMLFAAVHSLYRVSCLPSSRRVDRSPSEQLNASLLDIDHEWGNLECASHSLIATHVPTQLVTFNFIHHVSVLIQAEHSLIATLIDVLADVFDRLDLIAVLHISMCLKDA
jgi:hypothetical protein